jgi:hypothetical protein
VPRMPLIEVGQIFKWAHIYNGCELNHKIALYLGEDTIDRSDGVTIVNHKCWVIGAEKITFLDKGLMTGRYIRLLKEQGEDACPRT